MHKQVNKDAKMETKATKPTQGGPKQAQRKRTCYHTKGRAKNVIRHIQG